MTIQVTVDGSNYLVFHIVDSVNGKASSLITYIIESLARKSSVCHIQDRLDGDDELDPDDC